MSLESNKLKNGLVSYYYRFRYRGRWYRGYIGPKSLRQAKLDEMQARILAAEGKHPLPKRQQRQQAQACTLTIPTFLEFAPRFLASYAVDARPRSVRTAEDRLNLHILPYFAEYQLDDATTAAIDTYRTARRQEGAAPNTINGELSTLSRLLRHAVEHGIIPKSAVGLVRWLRVEERSIRVLSASEEDRLLIACTPRLRSMIRFGLQTGLRKTELLTLTWDAVDLVQKEVTVVATRAKNRHRRVVPLNQEALAALKSAHTRDGRVFGYHSISAPMDRAQKQSGLLGVNMHTLRKTFATRLLERGVDVNTVMRLLGHGSLAVTLQYLNTSPDHARQAVELLGKPSHRRAVPRES